MSVLARLRHQENERSFPCGISVKSKIGYVEGIITAVSIRFDNIQYEVSYFTDNEYKSAWLNESEFTTENQKHSIGFKSVK